MIRTEQGKARTVLGPFSLGVLLRASGIMRREAVRAGRKAGKAVSVSDILAAARQGATVG